MDLLYTVDRREGAWIVLESESGATFQLPSAWLPQDAREGDVVRATPRPNDADTAMHWRFALAPEVREQRREEAVRQRQALSRGPGGDLLL